jgi:hypothetical protein
MPDLDRLHQFVREQEALLHQVDRIYREMEGWLQQPRQIGRTEFARILAEQQRLLQDQTDRLNLLKQELAQHQQPIPLNSQNRFPYLVLVEIEFVPAAIDQSSPSSTSRFVDLRITLQFNLTSFTDSDGSSIQLGLRQGQLKLKLTNGRMSFGKRGFVPAFPIAAKRTVEREQTFVGNVGLGLGVERGTGTTVATEHEIPQVLLLGSDEEPIWQFQSHPDHYLFGMLRQEWFGTIETNEQACTVEATFEILRSANVFVAIEGEFLSGSPEESVLRRLRNRVEPLRERYFGGLTQNSSWLSRVEGQL